MAKQSTNAPAGKQSNTNEAAYIFTDALKAHGDDEAKVFALKIGAAFDERVQFEISRKASGSADMPKVKKLNSYRGKLALPSMAKVLMELKISEMFINTRQGKETDGDRFNIYAIDKVIDFVRALAGQQKLSNAHNVAIAKSMLIFEENGKTFTGEMAMCAASDKIRSQNPDAKLLRRHNVDKSTAGTQASSTLNALMALGLVKNTGTKRAATYVFANTNQAKAFKELLQAV
ncbi:MULTISPECIES: hypothetical protein [unclassified Ensifer]|uniref:hypothetical protein n=1 Tax=unclassified Ensifer TaxID=2633371 RepID=UPI0008130986|nr:MULTISPECIES: hypothetical protein [unclassified Ensifer]OCP21933.1 hypothetical protein BC361_25530 [Ensifer sp. LC54]OCP23287.1 hypothetical protein BC363_25235 [Ensifer sp. LC384]